MKENTARKDLQLLERADKAIQLTTPRMRKPTIEFLWDKYVVHAYKLDENKQKKKRSEHE